MIEAFTWVGIVEGEEEGNKTFYGKVLVYMCYKYNRVVENFRVWSLVSERINSH